MKGCRLGEGGEGWGEDVDDVPNADRLEWAQVEPLRWWGGGGSEDAASVG